MKDTPAYRLARDIAATLTAHGHQALWAGGCVRDLLLGREPKDYDIATAARPEDIQRLFPDARGVGRAFGVMLITRDQVSCEVATFRRDLDYRDGRHPDRVEFCDAEEDARRRDFTVNGLFLDPRDNTILDYVGGQADLRARLIRAIGDPAARFREDHLRLLRAVRFASTLEFTMDPATLAAIRTDAALLGSVSAERIQQELTRLLLEAPRAGAGVELLQTAGLLPVILPEITAMIGVEQPPEFHPEGDVFRHTMIMLDMMGPRDAVLAWSVLLHDVGKPPTFQRAIRPDGSERIRFERHADVGAEMAEAILRRLRCSNELIAAVTHCVRNHMRFGDADEMRESTLRRLVGAPTFPTELELHRIDCESSHRILDNHRLLTDFAEKLRNEPVLPPPWISGRDIMALGVPEGREVGRWRNLAYEAQLEGRCPDRESLLAWLKEQMKGDARSSSPSSK